MSASPAGRNRGRAQQSRLRLGIMSLVKVAIATYRFGAFRFEPSELRLLREGRPVQVQPQPLRLLAVLVEAEGRLVTRDELRGRLWPIDTHVDYDRVLNFSVRRLRVVLGDDARAPRFIETVPRVGYRFIAALEPADEIPRPDESLAPWRRWVPMGSMAASALLLLVFFWLASVGEMTYEGAIHTPRTVVILPLINMSGDPNVDHVGAGLADSVRNLVAAAEPSVLGVVGERSTESAGEGGDGALAAARRVGADQVIEGRLSAHGGEWVIEARLLDVSGRAARETWRLTAAIGTPGEPVALAARLAEVVAGRLLGATESRRWAERPDVLGAYWRGRYLRRSASPAAWLASIEHYDAALKSQPDFAPALSARADAYISLGMAGAMPAGEAYARSRDSARQALAVDPRNAEAHAALGLVAVFGDGDWDLAARSMESALQSQPGRSEIRHAYALYLAAAGRVDDAGMQARLAAQLDPLNPLVVVDVGWYEYLARRYPAAIAACTHALELEPGLPSAATCLEYAQLAAGHPDRAAATVLAQLGRSQVPPAALADVRARAATEGLPGIRRWFLERVDQVIAGGGYACLAVQQLGAGRPAAAFASLEQAVARRESWIYFLRADPLFDSLRSEPKFIESVDRVGPRL